MKKYSPVIVSDIIVGIGFEISPGYYRKIIEIVFPDDDEINKMGAKENNEWIVKNNELLIKIIDFLNSENNENGTTT